MFEEFEGNKWEDDDWEVDGALRRFFGGFVGIFELVLTLAFESFDFGGGWLSDEFVEVFAFER